MDLKVTLVTVAYNSSNDLKRFWQFYDPSWGEWVVVDNASTDDSAAVAESLGAKVVRSPANIGFAQANNMGAAVASGEVLIFCNPDISVTPAGINELARVAMSEALIVAPQLLNADGTVQENGRGAPYLHRKVLHLLANGQAVEGKYTRLARPGERRKVVWAMGAALAMSVETFRKIGGWNGKYFIYYEDAEISLRALQRGVPTVIVGSVRWTHGWARETAKGFSAAAWRFEIRSAARFYLLAPYRLLPVGQRGRQLRAADKEGVRR